MMNNDTQTVGRLISYFRRLKGIKQSDLAEDLGIKQSVLSEIEINKHAVTVALLLKCADRLGILPSALLPQNGLNVLDIKNLDEIGLGTDQNKNPDEEKMILKQLINAKDQIIFAKDELISQLRSREGNQGERG